MQRGGTQQSYRLSRGGLLARLVGRFQSELDDRTRTRRWALVLGAVTWLPLFVLSWIDGTLLGEGDVVSFLADPSPHARFLIALPALLFAGRIVDPFIAGTLEALREPRILPQDQADAFQRALARMQRRRDSLATDGVLIVLAVGLGLAVAAWEGVGLAEPTGSWAVKETGRASPAGLYLLLVSGPVLIVLLWRWLWRFVVWVGLLHALRRIPWRLVATHPDRSGGLSPVAGPALGFVAVFMVMGVLLSGRLAQDILFEEGTLRQVVPDILVFLLAALAALVTPLALFTPQLARAKRKALYDYAALGTALVETFQQKWVGMPLSEQADLVQQPDPSALADFSTVFETVRSMRLIPIGVPALLRMVLFLLLPFLPLVFVQFSPMEVAEVLLKMLGLPTNVSTGGSP